MSQTDAKHHETELPLFYMSGSVLAVRSHELVTALRTRPVIGFLMVVSVLIALPETPVSVGVPLWARIALGIISCIIFIEMMSASVSWVTTYGLKQGWTKLHVCRAATPTAILVAILTDTAQLMLLGTPIERSILLAKIVIAILFWETVIFILLWFYIPGLARREEAVESSTIPEIPTIQIGGREIVPDQLRRIETDGRQLHLHILDKVETVTAKMRDTQTLLEPYGLVVHRCHWVALDQLGPVHREGRTLIMTTRAGDSVPVSRERRKDVEALASRGAAS